MVAGTSGLILVEVLVRPLANHALAVLAREGARLTVSCEDTATVGEVLELMHVRAVHRVWVVDDARRPVGVISLADVLAVVSADERASSTDSTTRAKITGESESAAA